MVESNKLVTMIALVIAGLLIAIWGGVYIWLYRNDQAIIVDLQKKGAITSVDVSKLTNPTWMWVLAIIQIIIGVGLIIWGIFQYFAKVDDVATFAKKQIGGLTAMTSTMPNGSRRTVVTPSMNL